jgi:hypothetical protein
MWLRKVSTKIVRAGLWAEWSAAAVEPGGREGPWRLGHAGGKLVPMQ